MSQGLICVSTVQYGVPAFSLEVVRRTGSSCCHNGGTRRWQCQKNIKLLRTTCISQAQDALNLVFDRGSAPNAAEGAYDGPPEP